MIAKWLKRIVASVLAAALLLTAVSPEFVSAASGTPSAQGRKPVTVTPFAGQWKYYGQKRQFARDEHYSMSGEVPSKYGDWELMIDGEEIGEHRFIVTGSAVSAGAVRLISPAPPYEIREFRADAQLEMPEILTVTGSAILAAPDGYLISGEKRNGKWTWLEELETRELPEGETEITYYLRSNKNDDTKNAIDVRPKTLKIRVDATPPFVTSLLGGSSCTDVTAEGSITGSEPGLYYYIVLPASSSVTVTPEFIQEMVAAKIGIGGFGRLDGKKAAPLHFEGLSAQTEYVIYACMLDEAGNASPVMRSDPFSTDNMNLAGSVEIQGTVETDSTLTAVPSLSSVDAGELTYQWYRIKKDEDEEKFEEVYDETGGAEEDDLEADYSDDDEDEEEEEEEEDDDEDDEDFEEQSVHLLAVAKPSASPDGKADEIPAIDGATMIDGAVSSTYKVTRKDIGYRLVVSVTSKRYSGYLSGTTTTFVPKLMPQFTKPSVASAVYSPTRKLSSIPLPQSWSWVDKSIVPVYKNSGYRARFVPKESNIYKTVIVRVPIPITKRKLKKSMVKVKKSVAYTGKAIKDNVTVKDGNKKLTIKKDYRVTWSHNVAVGKASCQVKGIGNYTGKSNFTFQIKKRALKNLTYQIDPKKVYSGKKKTARLIVKNGSVRLKKNKDYTAKYKNNVEIGKAKIQIRGKGNYYGQKTVHFSIIPKKPKITNATAKKGSFSIKLNDRDKVKGYQVFVSTSSNFKKSATQDYNTSGGRFGVNSLKKGTYYVRTKAYCTVGGKKYSSYYSKAKTIKVK